MVFTVKLLLNSASRLLLRVQKCKNSYILLYNKSIIAAAAISETNSKSFVSPEDEFSFILMTIMFYLLRFSKTNKLIQFNKRQVKM